MKRSALIPAIEQRLREVFPTYGVIVDNFSRAAADAMETALRDTGVCLAIKPLLASKRASQAGERVAELVDFAIHVRVNPEKVPETFNTYQAQDDLIARLCGDLPLAARAGSSDGGDVTTLVPEDHGCLTHAVLFHVQTTNR